MPNIFFRSLVILSAAIASLGSVNAQRSNSSTEPSGKVIEIHSERFPKPALIALSSERSAGFWASGFPRLKDWQLPNPGDPIQVIDFHARLVGDQGQLVISLYRGKRFGEIIENIAHIVLSEGDTVVVSEMKKFGFEPVTVRMSRVSTTVADVPMVSNPAPLLRTTVSNVVSTLPVFKIRFLNESDKNIMAFDWHTETGGRGLLSGLAQGRYGRPLIEANGTYEMTLNAENPYAENPYASGNIISMVIGAVIYEDGSIDGDAQRAANFLSFTDGRKKALDQLIPLLLKATEQRSQRSDIPALIAAVDALKDGGPKRNGRSVGGVAIAFDGVITEALISLRKLNSESAGKTDEEVSLSLRQLTDFYRDWQSRMQK